MPKQDSNSQDDDSLDQESIIDTTDEEEESPVGQAEQSDLDLLQEKLDAAKEKEKSHWDALLRVRAEFENYQKRAARDLENAHKYSLEKFASELLGVIDSMELGLQASNENEETDVKSLIEGTELTLKKFFQIIEKFGIKQVNPVNEKFNPDLQQAMSTQESDSVEPGMVVTVMQKGYTINDRLLRPALVVVSKAAEPQQDEQAQVVAENEAKE